MEQQTKVTIRNYAICVAIELIIAFLVVWSKCFFTESTAVNIQILSDAFFVSGILMTLFSGLLFVSGEGALIGVGFVFRHIVLAFIPNGRTKWERYGDYRERKLNGMKERKISCIFITGLCFLSVGVCLTVIWYTRFYNV